MRSFVVVAALLAACGSPLPEAGQGQQQQQERAGIPFALDRLTERFEGEVVEAVSVSGYSYFCVSSGSSCRWVASLKKEIAVGEHVSVRSFGRADSFTSKKLGRTFDRLWFAVVTKQGSNA